MTVSASAFTVVPRMRVIIDNDFSGDPDGLFQLVHHALSPSVDIRAVIGSHLRPDDPFDPSDTTADNAAAIAREYLGLLGRAEVSVIAGSNVGLSDRLAAVASTGAEAIVAEAMRDDTDLPLYVCCGASLTELASAWLMEPRIADRLTVVWIGGAEHPGLAVPPPGASELEYNLAIDVLAAQVVFGDSAIPIWQVPRDAYRQTLVSLAELDARVATSGVVGERLVAAIAAVSRMAGAHGVHLGETYIMGDSPLVLLTALQSAFEADPSSSAFATVQTPHIGDDGSYLPQPGARPMRVYSRLDLRLMFDDFYNKLVIATPKPSVH